MTNNIIALKKTASSEIENVELTCVYDYNKNKSVPLISAKRLCSIYEESRFLYTMNAYDKQEILRGVYPEPNEGPRRTGTSGAHGAP